MAIHPLPLGRARSSGRDILAFSRKEVVALQDLLSYYFSPIPRLDLERIVYENKKNSFFLAPDALCHVLAEPGLCCTVSEDRSHQSSFS